jgi:hypothetical protein
MGEWVYKATRTKIGPVDTTRLAREFHFLCRSAFRDTGARPARVAEVRLGDIIYFYYRIDKNTVETIGTFEVVGHETYPELFARSVPKTALVVVREDHADLIELLEREHKSNSQRGYKRDPKLDVFTGWALRERKDRDAPEFSQSQMFPGAQHNLWHYPDTRLPFGAEL